METIKKPPVNKSFKEGYDMGYRHAKIEVVKLIDEMSSNLDRAVRCHSVGTRTIGFIKIWLKNLKERIEG